MPIITLNATEWLCCFIALAMQVVVLRLRWRPKHEAVLVTLAVAPATMLAAASFTRFLSWDESYIFYDIVNYYSGRLPQWEMGSFRTTTTVLGPLFALVQALLPVTKDLVLVLVKAAHWLTGYSIVTIVADQVHHHLYPKVNKGVFHGVVVNAMLLLPVTGLALKTLNYDLLSMLLGVLGCIWCVAGLHPLRKKLLFSSILVLSLAAHEKLIASPLLWIALIVIPIRLTVASNQTYKKMVIAAGAWSIMVTLLTVVTIGGSFLIVYLTHGPLRPVFNADQLFMSWMSSVWPLLRLGGKVTAGSLHNSTLIAELPGIVGRTVLIAAILFVSTVVFCTIITMFKKHVRERAAWLGHLSVYTPLTLLTVVTIVGVIAQYSVKVWIWPDIPVGAGNYTPALTFNGIAHHFGCRTLFTHTLASMAWACTVFVNALPGVVLLLIFVAFIRKAVYRSKNDEPGLRWGSLLFTFFIMVPLFYGALQIPLYARYLNLFILGTVVIGVSGLFALPLPKITKPVMAALVMVWVALFAEVLPFQPLGAAFRPIWSNYSKEINQQPCFGKVTPWYPGWGEELFGAWRKIENGHTDQITLYYNFPAALIQPPANVQCSAMPYGHGQIPYRYTGHDYYILSRNGISSYPYISFPEKVRPLFTLADRGFVKAWIFRGSDLASAGFRFRVESSNTGTGRQESGSRAW